MSSMHRTVEGDVLLHHLTQDELLIDAELLARTGRTARTLVKEGPLRLTLLALGVGGDLPEHSTDGPISIHMLRGDAVFRVLDADYALATGDVLALAPGVRHAAKSAQGCTFLLTVVHNPSAGSLAPAV